MLVSMSRFIKISSFHSILLVHPPLLFYFPLTERWARGNDKIGVCVTRDFFILNIFIFFFFAASIVVISPHPEGREMTKLINEHKRPPLVKKKRNKNMKFETRWETTSRDGDEKFVRSFIHLVLLDLFILMCSLRYKHTQREEVVYYSQLRRSITLMGSNVQSNGLHFQLLGGPPRRSRLFFFFFSPPVPAREMFNINLVHGRIYIYIYIPSTRPCLAIKNVG